MNNILSESAPDPILLTNEFIILEKIYIGNGIICRLSDF